MMMDAINERFNVFAFSLIVVSKIFAILVFIIYSEYSEYMTRCHGMQQQQQLTRASIVFAPKLSKHIQPAPT